MKRILITASLILAATFTAHAQLNQVKQNIDQRLESALEELAALRQQINQQVIPLTVQRDELQSEVANLQEEATTARRRLDTAEISLNQLESRVEGLENNENFLLSNLNDYRDRFHSQLHPSEKAHYAETIRAGTAAQANQNLSPAEKLRTQLAVVDASLDRLKQTIGGYRIDGTAFGAGDAEVEGTFANIGPLSYFSSGEPVNTGMDVGTDTPKLYQQGFGKAALQGIIKLVQEGEGSVPVDPTGGRARQLIQTQDDFLEFWAAGGWVIVVIAFLLLLAALMILYKLIQLSSIRSVQEQEINAMIDHVERNDIAGARAIAEKKTGPGGELLRSAAEHANDDREVLEEAMYEKIIRAQPKIESMLPLIAAIAATAPLLGLLGTVTGMIKTFKLITVFGTGDAGSLATGISEALVTTMGGLIVAIFALILHALLSFMAKRKVGSLEQAAVSFVNAIGEMRERKEHSSSAA